MSEDFAVIFDLDGLLADTEPLWTESSRLLLSRRGRVYDPSLKKSFMGRHPMEVMTTMIQHYDLTGEPEELVAERLEIQRELYRRDLRPLPGALELVGSLLDHEVPMIVASGSPAELVTLVLAQLKLDRLLSFVDSGSLQRGKPAPDLFLLAAERLHTPPARCVVLEDAVAGVQAALAAGMACVAVPGPDTPKDEVGSAHLIVQSLEQLSPSTLANVIQQSRRSLSTHEEIPPNP